MKTRNTTRSEEFFREAQTLLPGGVDSPVRAFRSVNSQPLFIDYGEGAYVFDVDGNRYLDYVLSWGPLILGHANHDVSRAIYLTAQKGTSFGAPTFAEVELAQKVMGFFPNIERIRFVNSGTEATMSAVRLARAYTKRDFIIKFEGCYHGHADTFLVQAGSGVATLGLPDSPGVPASCAEQTLIAPYNDLETVKNILQKYPDQIAAIIVEPVAGNMGVVPPVEGFLTGLREVSSENGALLIFDEVMTGFRVHPNGAQTLFNIKPDLTTLGKVIGGGLPIGAFGGKAEIMDLIAPSGPVYQAGTFSGNPLSMAAGVTTLQILESPEMWEKLENRATQFKEGVDTILKKYKKPYQLQSVGSMFTLFFTDQPVINWSTANRSNRKEYAAFFRKMLNFGVYLAPSQFEAGFLSTMHSQNDILYTLEAIERSLA